MARDRYPFESAAGRLPRGLTALIALTVLAAGCSGTDAQTAEDPSTGDIEAAASMSPQDDAASEAGSGGTAQSFESTVEDAKAAVTDWPGPETPVEVDAEPKLIYVITCSSLGIGCVRAGRGVTAAGEALGWTTRVIDGQGDPAQWNAGVRTALDAGADGIVLAAVPPALVGDGLEAARAQQVPVASLFVPVEPGTVTAVIKPDHYRQGQQLAAFVAAESGEAARVVLIEDNEFPELVERADGFRSAIAECGDCEIVDTIESQIANFAERLPGAVVSSLQRHPDVTHVVSPFDSNATFAVEGVRQAGRDGEVAVVGYEGDPQAIATIAAGGGQIATIANPAEWMGWQAVDELLRAFAGQPAVEVEVPSRLITADNAPDTEGWLGDLDFQTRFKDLWGLG